VHPGIAQPGSDKNLLVKNTEKRLRNQSSDSRSLLREVHTVPSANQPSQSEKCSKGVLLFAKNM
jgi:hypothetical protein